MRGRPLIVTALASLAGLGAYAAGAAAPTAATVKVTMKEWSMPPVPASAKPGNVTFDVRNAGKLDHEFVLLRTNLAVNKLSVKGAKAQEPGFVARIWQFKPGETRKVTLVLKAGKYVLLCNLPAHYKAGQRAAFRVGQ